jgi:hypothetical protein
MKKLFPIILVIVGLGFLAGGAYATMRGLDAKAEVRETLLAQNITTPSDAAIRTFVWRTRRRPTPWPTSSASTPWRRPVVAPTQRWVGS